MSTDMNYRMKHKVTKASHIARLGGGEHNKTHNYKLGITRSPIPGLPELLKREIHKATHKIDKRTRFYLTKLPKVALSSAKTGNNAG